MNNMSEKRLTKQSGLTLVLITLTMVILLGFSALAIDVNHALLNKTRLQNIVDTAALSAAVLLDSGGDEAAATVAIHSAITGSTSAAGNTSLEVLPADVDIDFSNNVQSFTGSHNPDIETYVRVAISDITLENYFLTLFGVNKSISVSAVAGPSSSIVYACNIVPMAVCAASSSGANDFLGFNFGEIYALKVASANQSEMGPGNFQLLDFGSGASTVRTALAGGYDGCVDLSNNVTTKPGNTVGPVGQGLNTRFGQYKSGLSSSDYPADIYIKEPDSPATIDRQGNVTYTDTWGYDDYVVGADSCAGGSTDSNCTSGERDRRILSVPMVNCSGEDGGSTTLTMSGIGCFFLLQKAPTNNSGKQAVFGEFLEDCTIVNGSTGITPSNEGPYKIQLYRDLQSGES